MKNNIYTFNLNDNEIQRVQVVELNNYKSLNFFYPKFSKEALKHLTKLYEEFFIKKYPLLFGTMYIYHIPNNYKLPFNVEGIKDKYIASKIYLKKHLNSNEAQSFINDLKDKGYLYILHGKNKFLKEFVGYKNIGFMSKDKKDAKLKVNSSFFTFLSSDVETDYDIYGTPIGMYIKNGKISNPPLFNREAYLVYKDGRVEIRNIDLKDIDIHIKGTIYQRNKYKKTPKNDNYDLVIIGDEIVAINYGGNTSVPSSGFVVSTKEDNHKVGEKINYTGLEDIVFGIQCGNSAIINGNVTKHFISKFTSILKLENNIPPSMYPLNFNKDRAPRIVFGENKNHKPVIIWFEGKSKMHYEIGKDSAGVSLLEEGNILKELDIINAINLDGGGSAQILINNKRSLLISDRNYIDNKESERPIPIGIDIE